MCKEITKILNKAFLKQRTMLNVLFVYSHLNPQGPVNQLYYLCKYLDKTKIQPIVVTVSQTNFETSMHDEFLKADVRVFDLKLSKHKSLFFAKKRIQSLVQSLNIDIIQSYGFRNDIITSKIKNVIKITSVHNTLMINYKKLYGEFIGFVLGSINLKMIKQFDYVISCSNSVSTYLKTIKLDSHPIVNGIDPSFFSISNLDKNKLRENLQLNKEKIIFLTVSSKLKGKNVPFLINSFLNEQNPEFLLLVAGYMDPKVIKEYKNKDNLLFLGNISNLMLYMKASNYFISASTHEGMPNAVLESLTVGTPVILSDIPPHLEVINTTNKKIGNVFINNDADELFKSIAEIRNVDYDIISNNCIETIQKNFNAIHMSKKYEKYYYSVFKQLN